jgi:hypothetical protein
MTMTIRIKATHGDLRNNVAYLYNTGQHWSCMLANGIPASFHYAGIGHGSEAVAELELRGVRTGAEAMAIIDKYASRFMSGPHEGETVFGYELEADNGAPDVWIVQGEHWNVPGVPISAHASEDSANAKAAELVNHMLKDTGKVSGKPKAATPSDWAGVPMGWLQDYHGAAHCWVEVTKLTVEA